MSRGSCAYFGGGGGARSWSATALVECNTALPENNGETIFFDSHVSLDDVGDRCASINDCVSDRGASINDKVVNENSVEAQVESAPENVVPRRSTRVRKPVLRYGVVPFE